jgi:hypothetical protein
MGRLGTVELLIKVPYFVIASKLVITRRPTILSHPLQKEFAGAFNRGLLKGL